jgi:DNA repair protein RecN (Recombination protein N)
MLRFLSVRHLAIIDQLEIEFEPGFNVLTGETGAGKSVIVEAVELLVGGRASADLVRTGEQAAAIQAIFETPSGREVIVRREISAQGRSRAFIDEALATTAALRDLGTTLVDLHGQHEHQALLDPVEHVDLLDAFADHTDRTAATGARFEEWRDAASALDRTRLDDREKRARIEIASFQLQEIDKAAPRAGEDDLLAAERTLLANADRLSRLSTEAYAALYDGEHAALASLATVWKRVADLAAIDPRFAPYLEQRDDLKSRLEDLAYALRSYVSDLDATPDRLQAVEDRLAALERLKRRYGPTLTDVLARRHALADELAALEANDERIAALEAQQTRARTQFLEAARALAAARRAAASRLSADLERALAELAMPSSRVEVRTIDLSEAPDKWSRQGIDAVEFYLSPNPGEELRPLARIASGGELSRVMLALRTLAAPEQPGRTLIFDEVDSGIGGRAADAVGARLQALGGQFQVLCITHLPQIAARADVHFHISKQVRDGRTTTALSRLDASGRELEIARMIAGARLSPQVLASARQLLGTQHSEQKANARRPASGPGSRRRGA